MSIVKVVCLHRSGWDGEPVELLSREYGNEPGPTDDVGAMREAIARFSDASKGHWVTKDGHRIETAGQLRAGRRRGAHATHQLRCSLCSETWRCSEPQLDAMLRGASQLSVSQVPEGAATGIVVRIE